MKQKKLLGIEAHNIRGGGGQIHLLNLINFINYNPIPFDKVIIWTNYSVKPNITSDKIIFKVPFLLSFRHKLFHLLWFIKFSLILEYRNCDILLSVGGISLFHKKKKVIFLQNLLPFNNDMVSLYKGSFPYYKFTLLRKVLEHSIIKSEAVIFPSQFTLAKINSVLDKKPDISKVVYHGAGNVFFNTAIESKLSQKENKVVRFLYVSTFSKYKRQLELIDAFIQIINSGFNVTLSFAGYANDIFINEFEQKSIGYKDKIQNLGNIDYEKIPQIYNSHDILIFPSLIESFGIPLIEAQISNMWILFSDPNLKEIMDINNYNRFEIIDKSIEETVKNLIQKVGNNQIDIYDRKINHNYFSSDNSSSQLINFLSTLSNTNK